MIWFVFCCSILLLTGIDYTIEVLNLSESLLSSQLNLDRFYKSGVSGHGERICILDTGFSPSDKLTTLYDVESINFTDDRTGEDVLAHGTASISVLANLHPSSPGIVPNARYVSLKVVNRNEMIMTSSIVSALNYSIKSQCTIAILPFGGRDMNELAIVDVINKANTAGLLIVAAAGNDGPCPGSVLSPADHPAVISVGALKDTTRFLVNSSHGYRTHIAQRILPEFATLGYKIPAISSISTNGPVSGTSISCAIAGGVIALLHEEMMKKSMNSSPGLMRCILVQGQTRVNDSIMIDGSILTEKIRPICAIPDRLEIPSSSSIWGGISLYEGMSSRLVRIMVYIEERSQCLTVQSNCTWVQVLENDQTVLYSMRLLIRIIPQKQTNNEFCIITVGQDFIIPVIWRSHHSTLPMLRWFEKEDGDTLNSNGESAFTNYNGVLIAFNKEYQIDIVTPGEVMGLVDVEDCICFEICPDECWHSIHIVTEVNQVEDYYVHAVKWARVCSIQHVKIRQYIEFKPTSGSHVIYQQKNDFDEIVAIVLQVHHTSFIAYFGIEPLINGMNTYSSLGYTILTNMFREMKKVERMLTDEL